MFYTSCNNDKQRFSIYADAEHEVLVMESSWSVSLLTDGGAVLEPLDKSEGRRYGYRNFSHAHDKNSAVLAMRSIDTRDNRMWNKTTVAHKIDSHGRIHLSAPPGLELENKTTERLSLKQAIALVNSYREEMGDDLVLSITPNGFLRALVEY